jgi:MFS transporter, PAT family, beta-lactamase induction signal transducer AmpG
MTALDPVDNLILFASCGFVVTFSAASQHVLLLTYQIETLSSRDWGVGEGMSVFAFRMAILTGGAGALYLATFFSWREVYLILTFLMVIGFIAVLIMSEPDRYSLQHTHSFTQKREWIRYAILEPFKTFMSQKGWIAILVFMLLYRLPENLLSMMQTLFLLKLGFSYIEISNVAKIFGITASICGSVVGGYWIRLYGYKWTLYWAALLHGISCLLFLVQDNLGANLPFLYLTIGVEHFLSGVALTAFFSYQLTCVSITFAATQLALLTSIAEVSRTFASPLAGYVIDTFGWTHFLVLVILSSIPGVLWISRIPFSRP